MAILLVVAVALAALLVDRGLAWRHVQQRTSDGTAAVAAAKGEVVALTSVSAKHSTHDVARLLSGATAGFRQDFQKQSSAFVRALRSGRVASTGRIDSAGLASLDGDHATVLVAASGTVKNTASAKAEPRTYRLRASMQKVGGAWLVSGLEFVA